jgi:filamentous hemagglutinin
MPTLAPQDDGSSALAVTQQVLTVAGFIPGIGDVANLVNAGISIYRGNYGQAALFAFSAIPLVGELGEIGQAAEVVEGLGEEAGAVENLVNTGSNVVYRSVDEAGNVNYVGITNDIERRAGEQLADKGISIEPIPGLQNLARSDARAVEQALIENYGLPNLLNKINSISPNNAIYPAAMERAQEILTTIQFQF